MREYKPEYLGKVIEPDNQKKMTDFVQNKYESFSKIYETCKEKSDKISDIQCLNSNKEKELSVRVITDDEVLEDIKKKTKEDSGVIVEGDIITAS